VKKVKVLLRFPPVQAAKPMTSRLIREFGLDFNILQARVDFGLTGELVIEIAGEEENIAAGLEYLRSEGVEATELHRFIVWDEAECVSCGACTAVCNSGALRLDENGQLAFRQETCVVCERCVPACPFRLLAVNES